MLFFGRQNSVYQEQPAGVWRLLCQAAEACPAANQESIPWLAHTVPVPGTASSQPSRRWISVLMHVQAQQ